MVDPLPPPDIAVVIAAYNVERYIERSIRSALDQSGVIVEVILVDDSSTDATAAIAAQIDDPRLKIIRRTSNGGPSIARNQAFAVASAPWIAVLDGDDYLAPGRLLRCLRRAKSLEADIVIDNIEVHREADNARYPMFPVSSFARQPLLGLARFIASNAFLFTSGATLGYAKPIFSQDFLRAHGLSYDPDIRIGEDYMLLAQALACGARCAIEENLGYAYTVRTGSISHRLSRTDIDLIIAGDRKFTARYKLQNAAAHAQRWRNFTLQEIAAFTDLIDALKQKRCARALILILKRPTILLHLWRPVVARLQRLFTRPAGKQNA